MYAALNTKVKEHMVKPNFFIVGAAKSGTTSLYHYIKQHPDIFMPKRKERFFFSGINRNTFSGTGSFYGDYIIDRWEEYLNIFKDAKYENRIGEGCVAYLYLYNESIKTMNKYLKEMPKIIIILRNPIDRAYSNYLHHVMDGIENLSFEESIQDHIIELRNKKKWWWGFNYIDVGLYYNQVKAYINKFGDENVLIILYDDFARDPLITCRQVFNFLNVEEYFTPDTSHKYNKHSIPNNKSFLNIYHILYPDRLKKILRPILFNTLGNDKVEKILNLLWGNNLKKSSINSEVRTKLLNKYKEDIYKLEKLTCLDLSGWLNLQDLLLLKSPTYK